MPKKSGKKSKKASKGIPRHGRPEKAVKKSLGLQNFSSNVPLGNTNPTVVQGVMYGGMPQGSGAARGNLRTYRGKYTRG